MPTIEEIEYELQKKPDPQYVKSKEGYDYLEVGYVKRRANEIFGALGWSTEVKHIAVTSEGTTNKGTPSCDVMVTVQLTVHVEGRTVVREEVGNSRNFGEDAEASATKGAISDAVKRCLSGFGAAFGLHFYEGRGTSKSNGQRSKKRAGRPRRTPRAGQTSTAASAPDPDSPCNQGQVKAMTRMASQKMGYDADQLLAAIQREGADVDALDSLTFAQASHWIQRLRDADPQPA